MPHQTTVESGTNGRASPSGAVQRNVSALTHDLITLAELQTQLLSYDLREGKARMTAPILLFAIAVVLGLGAVPVLLMAIAQGLETATPLPSWAALLVTSLTAMAVAGLLGWIGSKKVSGAVKVFTRSQHELTENIKWIKAALQRQDLP